MSEFIKLTLADQDWTFRALDLDQIEQLEPQFAVVSSAIVVGFSMPKEFLSAVAEIAAESLKFRHPDITPERCRKLITVGTVEHVIHAIRGVSMLEPAQGEGVPSVVT